VKLGKRLKKLASLVDDHYDHIWDCCCDHGYLGAELLTRSLNAHLHFVDIIEPIMHELETKLCVYFSQNQHDWSVHCLDAGKIPLNRYSGKHLIIIAGVGGDLMLRIMNEIQTNFPESDIDFLLCPVHHQFKLREQLSNWQYGLLYECLIKENQRFYEIIKVSAPASSSTSEKTIHPVGEAIWLWHNDQERKNTQQYLSESICHYQRMLLSHDSDVLHIVQAYQSISKCL
jgi:tRNA (adenine22-N1)-methyltransferase